MNRFGTPLGDAAAAQWRTSLALAAIAAGAFVIYGSLVPFDFQTVADETTPAGLTLTPLAHASRTDFLSNVLLFLPFPFFLMGALCAGRGSPATRALAAAAVLAANAGLAWAVELAQRFLPSRTASWNDVIAAALAALSAVVMWVALDKTLIGWAHRALARRQPRTTLESLLLAYAVLIAVQQLLPLDLTIRPTELAQKYREGRIVLIPFAGAATLAAIQDGAGSLLRAIPLGMLGLIAWRPDGLLRSARAAFFAGLCLMAGIEGAQLFVYSRTFDVTDVCTGVMGIAIGAWAGRRLWVDGRRASSSVKQAWLLVSALVWTLVLLVRHWYPFDFELDSTFARTRAADLSFVPFAAYYAADPFAALNEAIVKGLLSVPVGVLLSLMCRPQPHAREWRAMRSLLTLAAAALFFVAIELGQLLLPARFPDITDVLIGVCGAATGMLLIHRFVGRRRLPQ
jgi:glycopeptide antibiotics resistance protein